MEKQEKIHPRVLNIEELSRFLNIPISSIYELAKKGKIPGRKIGKHWRFLEAEILRFLRGSSYAVIPVESGGLTDHV